MVLDGKSSQEYPVNAGICLGSILGLTLFVLYINDLADDVICVTGIYVDNTTLCSKCDHASDLWQQLELTFEFESDLQDIVDIVDFRAGKTQMVSLDWSNNTGTTNVKTDGSVLEKKSSFKIARVDFLFKIGLGLLYYLCC